MVRQSLPGPHFPTGAGISLKPTAVFFCDTLSIPIMVYAAPPPSG